MGVLDKLKGMFGRSKNKATGASGDTAEKAAPGAAEPALGKASEADTDKA